MRCPKIRELELHASGRMKKQTKKIIGCTFVNVYIKTWLWVTSQRERTDQATKRYNCMDSLEMSPKASFITFITYILVWHQHQGTWPPLSIYEKYINIRHISITRSIFILYIKWFYTQRSQLTKTVWQQ